MTYILAMTLYPQWQIRLQEEVDRVCGDRMPEPKDSPKMPVLRAVIKAVQGLDGIWNGLSMELHMESTGIGISSDSMDFQLHLENPWNPWIVGAPWIVHGAPWIIAKYAKQLTLVGIVTLKILQVWLLN
jgi:hypothetical protein